MIVAAEVRDVRAAPPAPSLDALVGIRFPFAVWVVLYHCGYLTLTTGVTFFFVLSGFILTYVYARGERMRVDLGTFMLARFSRMYPVYAWGLLLAVAWRLWAGPPIGRSLASLFAAATLVQAWSPSLAYGWNTPGWTCSDDIFFYLMFPLVVGFTGRLGRRGLVAWIVGWWLVGQAMSTVAGVHFGQVTMGELDPWLIVLKFHPFCNFPSFAIGVGAGRLYAAGGRLVDPARGAWISALSLVVTLWATLVSSIPYEFVHSTLLAPVYAALVWGLALDGGIARPLSHPAMMTAGRWSFAFYILQEPIGIPIFEWVGQPGWESHDPKTVALFLGVLLAASAATHHLIEKPAKRWMRGLRERSAAPAGPARWGPSLAGLAVVAVLGAASHLLPQTRVTVHQRLGATLAVLGAVDVAWDVSLADARYAIAYQEGAPRVRLVPWRAGSQPAAWLLSHRRIHGLAARCVAVEPGTDIALWRTSDALALGQVFGVPPLPLIEEKGLYGPERDPTGQPFRWTSGRAELLVPGVSAPAGHLRVDVGGGPATPLRIEVDDRPVWSGQVSAGRPLSIVAPLEGLRDGPMRIRLVSEAFVPRRLDPRRADDRSLGVVLRGIQLLP